jgi:hypothetical protein
MSKPSKIVYSMVGVAKMVYGYRKPGSALENLFLAIVGAIDLRYNRSWFIYIGIGHAVNPSIHVSETREAHGFMEHLVKSSQSLIRSRSIFTRTGTPCVFSNPLLATGLPTRFYRRNSCRNNPTTHCRCVQKNFRAEIVGLFESYPGF